MINQNKQTFNGFTIYVYIVKAVLFKQVSRGLALLCKSLTLKFFLLMLLLISPACRRKIADNSLVRTEAKMQKFAELLADAQDGWNICVENSEGVRQHFWVKFNTDGSLEMKGDNVLTGDQVQKSLYAVRDLQQPTLTFATYNYISILADPDKPNDKGDYGESRKFDIQYAFPAELVRNLEAQQDNSSIQSFALIGRLHDSKAWFERVGSEGIIAEKVLTNLRKMHALKWRNNESVNFLTVGDGSDSKSQYIYDLHLGGAGDPLKNVFSLTRLDRKGANFRFTFDCNGDMILLKAPQIPKRLDFYDQALDDEWSSSFFYDFTLTDSTKLSFKKQTKGAPLNQVQLVTLEAKDIDELTTGNKLGELCSDNNQQNLKSDTDAMFASSSRGKALTFWGYTLRNKRDAWDLRQGGLRTLNWQTFQFNGDNYHYLFITFLQKNEPFTLAGIRHPDQNSYKNYSFNTNNLYFLALYQRGWYSLLLYYGDYNHYYNFLKKETNIKMYNEFFSQDNNGDIWIDISKYNGNNNNQNRQNNFTLVPTISGFEFHRQKKTASTSNTQKPNAGNNPPTGIQVPLYLANDL